MNLDKINHVIALCGWASFFFSMLALAVLLVPVAPISVVFFILPLYVSGRMSMRLLRSKPKQTYRAKIFSKSEERFWLEYDADPIYW